MSSHPSHHLQEVLLAQFSTYVQKGVPNPLPFHFIFVSEHDHRSDTQGRSLLDTWDRVIYIKCGGIPSINLLIITIEVYLPTLLLTHHNIIFFVRPLHSKPEMDSYC